MDKAVFFDFDGVIHDTDEFHIRCMSKYFERSISEDEYKAMHDGNFYESVPESLKNADWDGYAKSVQDEHAAFKVEEKVKEHLGKLARSYKLFLITSGYRVQIEPYLRNNQIDPFFTDKQYYEDAAAKTEKFDHLMGRYNISPENSVFVTDTLGDVREAHQVGVRSIAVTFGVHGREHLASGEPYAVVDSWEEVVEAVEKALA